MPRKILIVDDNSINRQMLMNALSPDYDIIEAENGKEALALMHSSYKLLSAVLLDIVMPEMDGYEVLARIKQNPMLSQIPIIMVTGLEDEESRARALSLGANDFIIKPFNPDIVKHCVKNNIALRETASILNAIERDKLTGLYNREAFFQKVGAMIKDREPGYYILSSFDIDNFKLINDQYGAAEGDRILRDIGRTVRKNMDRVGGIVGRISADNFAALFPAAKNDEDAVEPIESKGLVTPEKQTISFSVGRYEVVDTSLQASAIYDRAYIAKQSVKGRFDERLAYFDVEMLEKLVKDQQIIMEMEAALSSRQFEVWFQPQYNHDSGALLGAEALVRWRHPKKGIVLPGEFIPLFEQNGFVYELDKHVWLETCRYLRKWIDEGLEPLPVSVNISRYDIFRADLIEVITGMMEEYRIPTELLHLEITESAFAKSTARIVEIVKQLIELGFTVEIDDFGSGYSSLNTLKSVPAQVVKLDMRFLENGDDARRGGSILESIVRMTKWLGMSVMAEGVETKEQGDFLKSIGCSRVQGYLYARPMCAEDYETHFKNADRENRKLILETVDNLDQDAFWDPESIDTLIFNSYVGAACVFEYYDGKIELLRVTDKYVQLFGGDMTAADVLKLDMIEYLDKEGSSDLLAAMEESLRTKTEVMGKFLFIDLPGCPHETYLRTTMRVIASTHDRHLVYCINENISEQRVSERKERQTARQLQALLDSINCGVTAAVIKGKRARYLIANDKYYELLDYTRSQYQQEIGDAIFSTIHPEDRQRVADTVHKTEATGEPASMEYRAVRRDGGIIWLRSLISMADFEEVEEKVQISTYTDITADKHIVQDLMDNLPCGAGICEMNAGKAHMTYLNKRYFTYFKHNDGSRTTENVLDYVHPDDRPALLEAVRPAFEGDAEGTCVVRVLDGQDEYIPFRISGVSMGAGEEGNLIYVTFVPLSYEEVSFGEMISAAMQAMMASSADLSFVKDKNLRYICCSRTFASMVGLESEKDVVGKTDYDLFEKELADRYVKDDRTLLESGKSIVNIVERIPSDDGRDRFSRTSKYLFYDSLGNVVGLYGTGTDITETREMESQQEFLINNIPGGLAIYEGRWGTLSSIRLTYFSDSFSELFGYTREEYERLSEDNPTGLVDRKFLPGLTAQIETLVRNGTPVDYVFRAQTRDGGSKWIHIRAVVGERSGEKLKVNAVLLDVTERQNAIEQLRISEQESRLAIRHSGNVVCRYDVAKKQLSVAPGVDPIFEISSTVGNVPYGEVEAGNISPETAGDYTAFYESISSGKKSGSVMYQRRSTEGWRWIEGHFSTIFSDDGEPVSAVMSFTDATEDYEKDAAYKKWLQSLHNKEPGSYSLFRCNISKKTVYDTREGELLPMRFIAGTVDFDDQTERYVKAHVAADDERRFRAFLSTDMLLQKYLRGERTGTLEYREKLQKGGDRWLRLTVDLVENPHSTDVEAYLLFENIDEAKRTELLTIERAETDALTGVLNRSTFEEKANRLIAAGEPGAQHALLMLDIDSFKLVNDTFGHSAGDQVLIDVANLLRTMLRREDLVGRLGGDEFIVFLNNIPGERIASAKAKQICDLTRRSLNEDVQISGSVGIAVCPHDGMSFDELYKKADVSLYHVKAMGRDNYAFYHEDMLEDNSLLGQQAPDSSGKIKREMKRRMLIVEDNELDYEMLANMFGNEFLIEKARDGGAALIKLRHYGTSISVVLLDLMMPGVDGFAVLEKMQQSADMRTIPVVVVSGDENRETSLRAIRAGATDYVSKPVDRDILRIRVQSAVSKAENERLRAKNSFLEVQNDETVRYKTVLERMGVAVAEQDWGKGSFTYSKTMSEQLSGKYDDRTLGHIFLSDLVADVDTVKSIQKLAHDIADDRSRSEGSMTALLKAACGKKHRFRINIYKLVNEFALTDKMILTFSDVEDEQH